MLRYHTNLKLQPSTNEETPQISTPNRVGHFSIVHGLLRDYELSARGLRYFKRPRTKYLNIRPDRNLANVKPDFTHIDGLDDMFKFIFDYQDQLLVSSARGRQLCADFVCWRSVLSLVMNTPYEQNDWCIMVSRVKDTFYLKEYESTDELKKRASRSDEEKMLAVYDLKFKRHCLIRDPNIVTSNNAVDESDEFKCVFTTKLNGIDIMYCDKMDGVLSDRRLMLDDRNKIVDLHNVNFVDVEVKSKNILLHQEVTFNRNLWCKCFPVGINDIHVGIFNDNNILEGFVRTNPYSLSNDSKNDWKPSTCLNFLAEFLMVVKRIMPYVNCPHTVYMFYFESAKSEITFERVKGVSMYSFIPQYYLEMISRSK